MGVATFGSQASLDPRPIRLQLNAKKIGLGPRLFTSLAPDHSLAHDLTCAPGGVWPRD